MPEDEERSPGTIRKRTLQERRDTKALKLKINKVAKMRTELVDTFRTQELVRLTSVVVPLQRLKIQDDPVVKTPEDQPEVKTPAPSQE